MTEAKVTFLSVLGCGVALLVQFAFWKVRIPRRQSPVIVAIFLIVLVVEVALLITVPALHMNGTIPLTLGMYVQLAVVYVTLLLCYLITFSAVEADSPTLLIIDRINRAGANGITRYQLEKEFTNDVLVRPRVKDLVKDKMAYTDRGKFRLTRKGSTLVRIFMLHRYLLGLSKGG